MHRCLHSSQQSDVQRLSEKRNREVHCEIHHGWYEGVSGEVHMTQQQPQQRSCQCYHWCKVYLMGDPVLVCLLLQLLPQ